MYIIINSKLKYINYLNIKHKIIIKKKIKKIVTVLTFIWYSVYHYVVYLFKHHLPLLKINYLKQ